MSQKLATNSQQIAYAVAANSICYFPCQLVVQALVIPLQSILLSCLVGAPYPLQNGGPLRSMLRTLVTPLQVAVW